MQRTERSNAKLARSIRPCLVALTLCVASVALTQQPQVTSPSSAPLPVYDVVSIHENKSSYGSMSSGMMSAGQRGMDGYTATNITIGSLVYQAYNVPGGSEITGLPEWAKETHFDINAKVTDVDVSVLKKLTPEQRHSMLAALLADRFHLQAHFVSKTVPTYDLVIARDGPKLKENPLASSPEKIAQAPPNRRPGSMRSSNSQMTAFGIPISNLAANLSDSAGRMVIDKTGLAGWYDIDLKWTPDSGESRDYDNAPDLFSALQQQLGLKLVPSQGPVETLVVDHIDRPTEN